MTQPISANLLIGMRYVKAIFEGKGDSLETLFDDRVTLYHRQSSMGHDLFVRSKERVITLMSGPFSTECRSLSIHKLGITQTGEGFSVTIQAIKPELSYSSSWTEECTVEVDNASGKIKQIARTISQVATPSVGERNSARYVTALNYYEAMVAVDISLCLPDLAHDATYIYGFGSVTRAIPLCLDGKRMVKLSLTESYFKIASSVLISQLSLEAEEIGIKADYKRKYDVTTPTPCKYLEFCVDTLRFNRENRLVMIGAKVERFTPQTVTDRGVA